MPVKLTTAAPPSDYVGHRRRLVVVLDVSFFVGVWGVRKGRTSISSMLIFLVGSILEDL